jgi:hypothetical protein
MNWTLCGAAVAVALRVGALHAQTQVADPNFNASVERPGYPRRGPVVAIDEAHQNTHTASGQYKPLADLLTHDGYRVRASSQLFTPSAFAGMDVLVVANANARSFAGSIFTEPECDAVRDWVRRGGHLLLIADHEPFGTSAANLSARFGVTMGTGRAFEPIPGSITTQLVFSRRNGLLGSHAILSGRNASEQVESVTAFTGQSLSVPQGATPLLILSPTAREAATVDDLNAEADARSATAPTGVVNAHSRSVAGLAQGVALPFGKGRVVVLGEAALFSAQVITFPDGRIMKIGMNVPGNDDRQFALNVLHWLTGLLH